MKKTNTKKVVKESVGRDLVGAGRFESKSSVVTKILKKYPTPEALAAGLNKLAKGLEGKAQAKVAELAVKAAACDAESYPAFVAKIAGLSKLWGYLATTAAAATLAAGATWMVKSFMDANAENPNATMGDRLGKTVGNMAHDASAVANKVGLGKVAQLAKDKAGVKSAAEFGEKVRQAAKSSDTLRSAFAGSKKGYNAAKDVAKQAGKKYDEAKDVVKSAAKTVGDKAVAAKNYAADKYDASKQAIKNFYRKYTDPGVTSGEVAAGMLEPNLGSQMLRNIKM